MSLIYVYIHVYIKNIMACSVLNYKSHFVNIEINSWKISIRKLRKSFCIIVKLYHLTHTHDCDIRYKEIY